MPHSQELFTQLPAPAVISEQVGPSGGGGGGGAGAAPHLAPLEHCVVGTS